MKYKVLLISISLLLLIPNFIRKDINTIPRYNHVERFNPEMASITSIDELERYADDSAASQRINIYSEEYTTLLAYVISCRFYQGFSHFSLNENWIAAISERMFGYGLASKVKAADIMQHPNAACSQQAIVMMAILARKNIAYRKVAFPHHYALEAKINNKWYFFDPNMEPTITLKERLHENWNGYNDSLKKYYTVQGNVNWELGTRTRAKFGTPNEVPAKNARIFQGFTWFLSKTLFCFPLLMALAYKRRPFMYVVSPARHFSGKEKLAHVFSA